MSGKLKLMSVVLVSAWLATTSGQNIGQQHPSPRLLIIGSYFSGDFGGAVERRYEVLRAFIVNYSNDTLKFWVQTATQLIFLRYQIIIICIWPMRSARIVNLSKLQYHRT